MSGEVIMNALMERRSCRKYEKRPVPHDVLERIIEAARRAPTARDRQELRFYVVESPEVCEKIGMETHTIAVKSAPHLDDRVKKMELTNAVTCGAPACIVISVENNPETLHFAEMDAGLAVENILIACSALGLRALPVGLAQRFNERGILDIVGAGKDEKMLLLVPLGYPDPEYDKKFLPEKKITSFVRYI